MIINYCPNCGEPHPEDVCQICGQDLLPYYAVEAGMTDYRDLLVKYTNHVGYHEGIDFLDDYSPYLTEDECKTIQDMVKGTDANS
jgi:hypothetical protein